MSETQSVCKHCQQEICECKETTPDSTGQCKGYVHTATNSHFCGKDQLAEPASTGEPPPTVEDYQELCAELYQLAGVLHYANLVPTLLLDKLSAGQRKLPIPKGDLLPFMLSDELLPSENPATNEGMLIKFTSGAARPSEPSAPRECVNCHHLETSGAHCSITNGIHVFDSKYAPQTSAEHGFTKGYKYHGYADEPVSDACGDGKHSECTFDFTKCHCKYRAGHNTMHSYANPTIAAPQPVSYNFPKGKVEAWCANLEKKYGHCCGDMLNISASDLANEIHQHFPPDNPNEYENVAPQPVSGEDEAFWKFMDENAEIVKRWPGWKRVAAGLPEVPVSGDAPKVEAIMLFDEFCRRFNQFSNYIPAEARNTYLIPLLEKLRRYFPPASQNLGGNTMEYQVVADKLTRDNWRVEAINHTGEGECFVTIFSGPDSETRAKEYASWKNQ